MIALCPNPFRDNELSLTREVDAMLRSAGYETWICPVFAEDDPDILPKDLSYHSLSDIGEECSLAVLIGGDGTSLA